MAPSLFLRQAAKPFGIFFQHLVAPRTVPRVAHAPFGGDFAQVVDLLPLARGEEGASYEEVSYAVRVLRLLGCDTLIVTNAAGCVNTAWQAGDLMLITDQIKIFMESPLRGENLPQFGVRFPDASHLYTPALQDVARKAAGELGIELKEGVYMYFPGPQYETPAEVRFARIAGADAVGMSTAPEVIVAGHCGMQVLGFTLLSNMAAGILDQPLSEEEVLEAAEACKDKFSRLVLACLKQIG